MSSRRAITDQPGGTCDNRSQSCSCQGRQAAPLPGTARSTPCAAQARVRAVCASRSRGGPAPALAALALLPASRRPGSLGTSLSLAVESGLSPGCCHSQAVSSPQVLTLPRFPRRWVVARSAPDSGHVGLGCRTNTSAPALRGPALTPAAAAPAPSRLRRRAQAGGCLQTPGQAAHGPGKRGRLSFQLPYSHQDRTRAVQSTAASATPSHALGTKWTAPLLT